MRELDNFYLQQDEPIKGTLLALRKIILQQDEDVTNTWKYGMPFFCYKGKMFCYLWFHKKHKQPYIGIVEGKRFDEPFLIQEGYLIRTPRGREATEKTYRHFNKENHWRGNNGTLF